MQTEFKDSAKALHQKSGTESCSGVKKSRAVKSQTAVINLIKVTLVDAVIALTAKAEPFFAAWLQ